MADGRAVTRSRWLLASTVSALMSGPAPAAVDTLVIGGSGVAWREVGSMTALDDTTVSGAIQPQRTSPDRDILDRLFADGRLFAGRDPTSVDYDEGEGRIWTPNGSFGENFELLSVADGKDDTVSFDVFNKDRNNRGVTIFIDLGTSFPVTEVSFRPLLFGSHRDLYMKGFELSVNDGSPASRTEEGLPLYRLVRAVRRNSTPEVRVQLEAQHVRFLKLRSSSALPFEIDRIEVRGSGFVREATYLSDVLPLGGAANLGRLMWGEDKDPGTELVVQTRVGSDATTRVYNRINQFGSEEPLEASSDERAEALWEALLKQERGSIREDVENWTSWSVPYAASGQRIVSTGPRQFIQFRVTMRTDSPTARARLDAVGIEFQRPLLSSRLVGSISPRREVEMGAPTAFRYVVVPEFGNSALGFDRVQIRTGAPATLNTAKLGDDVIPLQELEVTQADGVLDIRFSGDRRVAQEGDSLAFSFTSMLLDFDNTFAGEVFSSQEGAAFGQRVQEMNRGSLSVQATKSSLGRILGDVGADPNPFSPNGDLVNDGTVISVPVYQAFEPIPVKVAVFDLSGRRLRQLADGRLPKGLHELEWDGRDDRGALVAPGMYICSIQIESQTETWRRVLTLAVVY